MAVGVPEGVVGAGPVDFLEITHLSESTDSLANVVQ